MSKAEDIDSFDTFAEDLLVERGARPIIIIGASKVDNLLLEILDAHLLPKLSKAKEADELLDGDRPLSTFSSRIKICYRMGLVDKTLYGALERLRALRNPSAHSIGFDIRKSPTREHFAEFRAAVSSRSSFSLARDRYLNGNLPGVEEELKCAILTVCILLDSIRQGLNRTEGNATALRISAK